MDDWKGWLSFLDEKSETLLHVRRQPGVVMGFQAQAGRIRKFRAKDLRPAQALFLSIVPSLTIVVNAAGASARVTLHTPAGGQRV